MTDKSGEVAGGTGAWVCPRRLSLRLYSLRLYHAASSGDKFIRLIDGDEFIEMWQEYYDKMSDEDKNMLPLKRIAFLGNNE